MLPTKTKTFYIPQRKLFINNRSFRFSILVQLHHLLFKLGRECAALSLCHSRSSSSVLGQVYVTLIFLSR